MVVPLTMPAHARDAVRRQVLRDRAQERDATADRRLEAEGPTGRAREALELRAVGGHDVLVRRDHALAGGQGGSHQGVRRLGAAHRLHHDVDVLAGDQVGGRVGEEVRRDAGRDRAFRELLRNGGQHERPAVGRREAAGSLEEGPHDLAADGSGADDADAQGLNAHGGISQLGRCGRDGSERRAAGVRRAGLRLRYTASR